MFTHSQTQLPTQLNSQRHQQRQLNTAGSYQPKTPLEKHCAFFNRNKDGLLTPWETFEGFKALGYGLILSAIGTFIVHFSMSYPTLDTWMPDPFFTIHLKNINRCKHGSDSEVYDRRGEVRVDRAEHLIALFAAGPLDNRGIGLVEGAKMIYANRNIWDGFGWFAAIVEWGFLYILCAEHGRIPKEAVMAQYDGSLFYEIEAKRKKN